MARPAFSGALKGAGSVKSLIVTLAGMPLEAFSARTFKLRMPERGKVIGMTMNVAAKGGTHSTSTIDVQEESTSLLGATFDVAGATAGTPVDKEGSDLAAAADPVAKDAELRIVTAESGGTSPTVAGLTVQIDYIPLGD